MARMTKKQASQQAYSYMSAPDLYRMSATTQHMSALGRPRQRKLLRKMSRSMYSAASERSKQAQQLFDASMYRLQENIKRSLAGKQRIKKLKTMKQRQEQQLKKIQEYQAKIRGELDRISKIINRNRLGLQQQNVRQKGQMYRSINNTMKRQMGLLQQQGKLEMEQEKLKSEMMQVDTVIQRIQENALQRVDRRAETQAMYKQAQRLGVPFNKKALKGLILKELQTQVQL
jgi:hypothetical protein